MQAMWKHRHTVLHHGPAGRLGRRGLAYLLLFQVLLPLTAPMIDVYGLYSVLFLPLGKATAVWAAFTAVQVATAAIALHLDGERRGPLWSLPLQQVVYRQLMYLVVIQSTVKAMLGGRLRWHRMVRTGAAAQHARSSQYQERLAGTGRARDGKPRPRLQGAGLTPGGADEGCHSRGRGAAEGWHRASPGFRRSVIVGGFRRGGLVVGVVGGSVSGL
jgi:hypothetical protein